ncbi:MAG: DUF3179 domain-containing protein, partial [Candidatus Obscuribacterales bacterium]|nr:DUF3179 domain-containing protein [Candidatus Obscuribacterales bacterium]
MPAHRFRLELTALSILLLGVLGACGLPGASKKSTAAFSQGGQWTNTDFSKIIVPMSEFKTGGIMKDGIPAIDKPTFVDYRKADAWLSDQAPILVVTVDGKSHGYPLAVLLWHEIINDTVGGVPLAATYCPLCSAPIVFQRQLDGMTLTFGTTGRLRKSDLVMYDRQTQSWWQQYTGRCLVGSLAGKRLFIIQSKVMAYGKMKEELPAAEMLSKSTGYSRSYGFTPYIGYERTKGTPPLFNGEIDDRLPPLERVVGVLANRSRRAYQLRTFKDQALLNDKLGGVPLVLFRTGKTHCDLDSMKLDESRTAPTVSVFSRVAGSRTLEFYQ